MQFFLDPDEVVETQIDPNDPSHLRCMCQTFVEAEKCRHTRWIAARVVEQGGLYPIVVPEDLGAVAAYEAIADADTFRAFVLKYNKVRVIA